MLPAALSVVTVRIGNVAVDVSTGSRMVAVIVTFTYVVLAVLVVMLLFAMADSSSAINTSLEAELVYNKETNTSHGIAEETIFKYVH
jgi:nitrogen fixation protein FixH